MGARGSREASVCSDRPEGKNHPQQTEEVEASLQQPAPEVKLSITVQVSPRLDRVRNRQFPEV